MTDRTRIEWADATWNPIIGCTRVSPGCDRCYAVNLVHRGLCDQHRGLTIRRPGEPADWNGEVRFHEPTLDQPLRWHRPRRIFVCSLSDLFHPMVSDEWIARLFAVMALAPQHTFQVLTKRPQRMADLLGWDEFWLEVGRRTEDFPGRPQRVDPYVCELPNVWLGTSIESDRYTFRADHLRLTPAAVSWISAEPLLGPLPSLDLTGIDWIVAGGETGPGSRPMHPDWVRGLRDRTRAPGVDAAGHFHPLGHTAFFFKQWGDWLPVPVQDDPEFSGGRVVNHPLGGRRAVVTRERSPKAFQSGETRLMEPGETNGLGTLLDPDTLAVRVGKKAAGRELDGRTWDEYPEVPGA